MREDWRPDVPDHRNAAQRYADRAFHNDLHRQCCPDPDGNFSVRRRQHGRFRDHPAWQSVGHERALRCGSVLQRLQSSDRDHSPPRLRPERRSEIQTYCTAQVTQHGPRWSGDPIMQMVWPPGILIDPNRYRILTVEFGVPNLARLHRHRFGCPRRVESGGRNRFGVGRHRLQFAPWRQRAGQGRR